MKKSFFLILPVCLSLAGCTFKIGSNGLPVVSFGSSGNLTEEDAAAGLQEIDSAATTQGEFVFHENYSHAAASVDSTEGNETIFLYFGEKAYYPVDVPNDIEFITDNSKYIYAKDGSYSISVMSGVEFDQFSTTAAITNPETYSQYVLATNSESTSELKEAAVYLVNNKAIIARTYNCEEAFNVILQGMLSNSYAITSYESLDVSGAKEYYPSYDKGIYTPIVTAGLGDEIQKIYTFNEGTLTIAKELRQFDDACDTISIRLAVVANSDKASVYYNDNSIYYAEVSEYFAFVYKLNYNTVYTCFGYGEESKANAIEFINNQE